jgi:hypothetical protein
MNAIGFNFVKKFNNNELETKTFFRYKGKEYYIYFFRYESGTVLYSVCPYGFHASGSMNIDKVTSKYISLYDYNMMSQRTSYKMSLDEIEFFTPEQ